MEVEPSSVNFSYATIVVTKSRMNKGLLAIPVSLSRHFPENSGSVYLLNERSEWVEKTFTAHTSSSKERRVGGMKGFYEAYGIRDGEQLVLQVYDRGKYKITPERLFHKEIFDIESKLDQAPTDAEAEAAITQLARLTGTEPQEVIEGEYVRLASNGMAKRKTTTRAHVKGRERISPSLRMILTNLYHVKCQISRFSFLKKNGEPYFEVHHIDPAIGNHVKNVLVVSPNVHAQFTHASVEHFVDEFGWLRIVGFNGERHRVFQIVDQLTGSYTKEVHSI